MQEQVTAPPGTGRLETGRPLLVEGTAVEVRSRFDQRWSRGFVVVSTGPDGYRVRRQSDGAVLPTAFGEQDVREEKRRQGLWWY